MNLILTKQCNKGCPYCFAHQSRIEDPNCEMTVNQINDIIDKYNLSNVKLLGGEPTCHPQFMEIVDTILSKNKGVTLISNFLFNDDIKNFLMDRLCKSSKFGFLINSTDLDIKNRIETFSRNYTDIYSLLYSLNREESMSCGITIYEKNSLEYYINYLEFLYENIPNIERLRVSIDFPGDYNNKNVYNVVNNKYLGSIIFNIFQWCHSHFITPSIDCDIYPCLFNNKEEFKLIRKLSKKPIKTKCGYSNAPSDIFGDGTVSYCYPLKGFIDLNLNDFNSIKDLEHEFNVKYNEIKNKVCLPEECVNCTFYHQKICEGPCLAFYNLKELDIPK